jgi:hypothetical protein
LTTQTGTTGLLEDEAGGLSGYRGGSLAEVIDCLRRGHLAEGAGAHRPAAHLEEGDVRASAAVGLRGPPGGELVGEQPLAAGPRLWGARSLRTL